MTAASLPLKLQEKVLQQAASLPLILQEKILQEVMKQKVEDKKRMGWGEIHKYITCLICEEAKKGVRIEDDSEFWMEPRPEDLIEMPNRLIRPSKVYIIKCNGCGININEGETIFHPVTTVRYFCERPKDAIFSPHFYWAYFSYYRLNLNVDWDISTDATLQEEKKETLKKYATKLK